MHTILRVRHALTNKLICLLVSLLLGVNSAIIAQVINTVVGNGTAGFFGDGGPAINASLNGPAAVAFDGAGTIYIADQGNNRIRKVDAQGIITTIAGNGQEINNGDGGPALNAAVNRPKDLALDSKGNLYISTDVLVRKITPNGVITTVAGINSAGNDGNGGPATSARVTPSGIAIDGNDNLYIASANTVRKVDANGIITTVATASETVIGVAIDERGTIFYSSASSGRNINTDIIRRQDSNGAVSVIAGRTVDFGIPRFSGDGGPAANAVMLFSGVGLVTDKKGNLFFTANNRVRIIDGASIINTVAGNGAGGYSGDGGPPRQASFSTPTDVTFDNSGNAYIADQGNNRIRRASFNLPPTLVGGGLSSPRSATVGVPFSLAAASAFSDPEGQSLIYSSSPLPAGLSLNNSTGLIAGTPTNPGMAGITIAATDNSGAVVYSGFFLNIERNPNINQPPQVVGNGLSSPQSATVGVGVSISTAYAFSDPEGRTLSYISSPLPAGLSLNPGTGLISGTPAYPGQAGITVGVTDDAGNTTYSGFFLNIQSGPVVVGSGITSPQSATVGAAFSTPTAYAFSDPSGRPLRYSSSPLPAGLSLNATTGVISGTPLNAGTAGITVVATSENNVTIYSGFFLNIRLDPSVNVAPRVVGNGISSPQSGTVGVTFSTPTAYAFSDPEGRALTYSSSSLPDGLSINPSTGVITGTPSRAYTFGVTVGATDDGGSTVYSGFFVTIVNPGGGRVSAEVGGGLQVRVLGNPVAGDQAQLEVVGAAGQAVRLRSYDSQGRLVSTSLIEQAGEREHAVLNLGKGAGLYYVQVGTAGEQQVVKVLKL